MRRRAFTLVEVVIVVLMLGIVAAIGVPKVINNSENAETELLRRNVDALQDAIEYYYAETGRYPLTIEADLFRGNRLPSHPQQTGGEQPRVENVEEKGILDPTDISLTEKSPGAYWYNRAEGIVRARVANKTSAVLTQNFYNQVNGANPSRVPRGILILGEGNGILTVN